MADPGTRADVAHLVRRAAFGAPPEEVDRLADLGYEGAVDALCTFDGADAGADAVVPPTFETAAYLEATRRDDDASRQEALRIARQERGALPRWWLERMVAADHPLRERLAFHWHDHFATSIEKVRLAELLHLQQRTIHGLATGRFDDLVHALARDPAMLIWLDGRESVGGSPNENFGRELLELFTLGHGGGHGDQPYTEDDVAAASRALTGWVIDRETVTGAFLPARHDAGTKTLLGTTGPLGLDEVVAVTTSHPACAPHVVSRLWSRLARPGGPDDPVVRELAAGFADDLDIAALVRRLLLHPEFRAPATRTALVRTPVEWLVGIARTLGIPPGPRAVEALAALGQVPFLPPNVGGWPRNEAWLSTASARVRLLIALSVAEEQAPEVAAAVPGPGERPDHLARLLGIEGWGPDTAAVLRDAPDGAAALALALVAPEHVVS